MRNSDASKRILQLNESFLGETKLPREAFTKPQSRYPQIWVKLERATDMGGYYKLETDNWFRSWEGMSNGYGLMFRKFKVTGKNSEGTWEDYTKHKVVFSYLPSEFSNPDDDKSSNFEKSSGWLFIKRDLGVEPKDVEAFIKSNMKLYKP